MKLLDYLHKLAEAVEYESNHHSLYQMEYSERSKNVSERD